MSVQLSVLVCVCTHVRARSIYGQDGAEKFMLFHIFNLWFDIHDTPIPKLI